MARTRLSTRGQVVLPKEIRDHLGLAEGAELEVEVREGVVVLRPLRPTTVDDLLGMLSWDGPPKTLEEMDEAVARGARERS
jgi:AbrB family looped-hinge helix DNA binding protein